MNIKQKARQLRAHQTDAEQAFWKLVKGKQINGYKFRRQHPIPPYIVDFICPEKKLIIELDGGQHAETVSYDQKRTMFLESKDYQVLRFWNDEVLKNISGVYEVLVKHLDD